MNELAKLIYEAHGCKTPDVGTHFIDDLETDVLYDVYLWDWDVKILVPMPAMTVAMMQALEGQPIDLRAVKVRPIDAIAYALATYLTQPTPVRDYLKGRFGPTMRKARDLAGKHWEGMVVA